MVCWGALSPAAPDQAGRRVDAGCRVPGPEGGWWAGARRRPLSVYPPSHFIEIGICCLATQNWCAMALGLSEEAKAKMAKEFALLRPPGGFRVMLIDPPWDFKHYSENGQQKGPQRHYKTMTCEEIADMPLDILLADNAAVFAWVTWPLAMRWREVIVDGWGVKFASLAWEWIKFNPKTGKYSFGGGYGTRKNLEPCLLLTKGDPTLRLPIESDMLGEAVYPEGVRSVRDFIEAMPLDAIRAPRRQHSRKPDEQYERIETMFEGPYVELFSRADRPGWSAWGDQAGTLTGQ